MNIVKSILILTLFTINVKSYSAICTAIASTNFSLASTWSCGHVPTGTDAITIPSGYTVTITSAIDLTGNSNTLMTISGTLFFSGNTSKLELPATATVTINSGGQVTSDVGNNSQKFKIGNNTIWSSNNGTVSGPTTATGSSSPLPIELVYFTATLTNENNVIFNWQTATEANNSYFEIERSEDGFNFYGVQKINSKASNGNSNQTINYSANDFEPLNGISYYRLKQVDFSEKNSISKIVSINNEKTKNISFVIFPNPNDGDFYVNTNGIENNHKVEVLIYGEKNALIFNTNTDIDSISNKSFNFKLQNTLKSGLYQVLFIMEGIKYNCSLVVQ